MIPLFSDRFEAGNKLANAMPEYYIAPRTVVLGLPNGGVPIAYSVAEKLRLPMDIFVVQKLGTPGQKELAMGAITSGDIAVFNGEISRSVRPVQINAALQREKRELLRKEKLYSCRSRYRQFTGKNVIVVDDGVATGATMRAAIAALRKLLPARIIIAVPVAPEEKIEALHQIAEEVVCLSTPHPFLSVGSWYENFAQVSDSQVISLLSRSCRKNPFMGDTEIEGTGFISP